MTQNLILKTDSYKLSHFKQYPPGTTRVSSYIEARTNAPYQKALFFGLQGFLKEHLSDLAYITQAQVAQAEKFAAAHGLPFNKAGWDHIISNCNGFLPIRIEAIPEGSYVPVGTPLVQVVNTDPDLPWITSYVETVLLRAVWYPTTVATRSKHIQLMIADWLNETCDDPASVLPFRLHDFGARGVSSGESAAIGGAAHLINFMGSDTIEGILWAREFYGEPMAGFSIPAAEHSTITAWGRDGERNAYANMLEQFPAGLVAVVSDSYDIFNACRELWGEQLKSAVLARNGTLVVRPDSGPMTTPVEVVQVLAEKFGTTTNGKGYKVLNSKVRVIQGDGVEFSTINIILSALQREGYSAENIAFGMGGQLLQAVNRDTLGFAMKANAIEIDGTWRDVYKDPKGDSGKKSKRGRLAVDAETLQTVRLEDLGNRTNLLQPVWENGRLLRDQSFADIRERASHVAV